MAKRRGAHDFHVVLSLGTIASLTWMHKRQFRNIAENQSIEVEKSTFLVLFILIEGIFLSIYKSFLKAIETKEKELQQFTEKIG